MAELIFGSFRFQTTAERDNYFILHRKFMQLGKRIQDEFYEHHEKSRSADDFFRSLPAVIEKAYSSVISAVEVHLTNNCIYDISERVICGKLIANLENESDRLNQVIEEYLDIVGAAEEARTRRQEAKRARSHIVGGGFGVEGAIQGMAVAAAANVAIGLVHGLAGITSELFSSIGDTNKKQQWLKSSETKEKIGSYLYKVALQGCAYVAETVNTIANRPVFDLITDSDRDKSAAIISNILSLRVHQDKTQPLILQALELNPYNESAWIIWLDRFGDQNRGLSTSANHIGIAIVKDYKAMLYEKRKNNLSWDTLAKCNANSAALEKHANWLGLLFVERDLIKKRIADLEKEARTYNGVEYATLADAQNARTEDQEKPRRTYNGVEHSTLTEAQDARIEHQDKLIRTVNGVTYNTYQEANTARSHDRDNIISRSNSDNFFGWIALPYRRFLDMNGRSCRKEFIGFVASLFLLVFLTAIATISFPSTNDIASQAIPIFLFLTSAPAITLHIRRFHDHNKSGWFMLIYLVPYVGWIIVLFYMLAEGTQGDNRFGPNTQPSKSIPG